MDDEPAIPVILESLLEAYAPQVQVLGSSTSWVKALEEIPLLKPDVLFLDIRMPEGSGFEFLKQIQASFEVIFVTGFQDYALQALKAEAADYLLKPVDHKELIQAVEKVEKRMASKIRPEQAVFIQVHQSENVIRILIEEIVFVQASRNYCKVHTLQGKAFLLAKPLKAIEEELHQAQGFIRISREVLVQTKFIKGYSKYAPYEIWTTLGQHFAISRRRRTEILQVLEGT